MTDEKTLIEACKGKDHKAYETLYKKYASKLMGIALRYATDADEAADILQESFIRIFDKITTFDHKGSFEGWLKRVVVNTAINYFHKQSRIKDNFPPGEMFDAPNEEPSALDNISASELLKTIQALPGGYRIVFNMHVIEGYTHKEIATALKITEGTSKSQFFKARNMLKNILSKQLSLI